jgi:ABC-2 type transport system permease protein
MRAILAIARKDIALFFGDRRSVFITLITPIFIGAFFGYIFGGSGSSERARIAVVVADADASAISKDILKGLQGDASLDVTVAGEAEARKAVGRGKAAVGVVFPAGFGKAAARAFFSSGPAPDLAFLVDPSRSAEMAMVRGILTQHAMEVVSREVFAGPSGKEVTDETLAKVQADEKMPAEDRKTITDLLTSVNRWRDRPTSSQPGAAGPQGGLKVPFTVKEEAVTAKAGVTYNGYAHSFAGMAVQFVLFAAIELGVGILLERQRGLWRRLRAAPVSKAQAFLGKALGGAAVALLCLVVTLGASVAFFGVRVRGSLAVFLLLLVGSALMATAFGLMLAALGRTPGATRGLAIFAVLVMVMLGGGWVPAFIFPAWLQKVTLAVPTRWAMDGFDAVTWRGVGFAESVSSAGVVFLFAALFGLVALWRFPWEEE